MPKLVDPQERRSQVAEAVLAVAHRDGLEAASLRNVAAEAGLAIGSVRHYFSDQETLMSFVMEELGHRIGRRVRVRADEVRDAVSRSAGHEELLARTEELLGEFLPLDEQRRRENELWHAFTTAARTQPALQPHMNQVQDASYALVSRVINGIRETGALPADADVDLESVRLCALVDGLTLQAVLQPEKLSPELMRDVLRHHLRSLAAHSR